MCDAIVTVQDRRHPQTIAVCQSRADGLGLEAVVSAAIQAKTKLIYQPYLSTHHGRNASTTEREGEREREIGSTTECILCTDRIYCKPSILERTEFGLGWIIGIILQFAQ